MESTKYYLECQTYECELNGKEIPIIPDESGWLSPICKNCHKIGRIVVYHQGRRFSSKEEFETYAAGLNKEYNLLKRLLDGGIGTEDDKKKVKDIESFLKGVNCSFCGQPYLRHNNNES